MADSIAEAFESWLGSGGNRIGEIVLTRLPNGAWELRNAHDMGRLDLAVHTAPESTRHIAQFDPAGKYRPLKTAPNLARGWSLVLDETRAVQRALSYFYPAMIGLWQNHRLGRVEPVFLRETLGRQSGMYRITQKVTDEEARITIDTFCSGCLKHRLWEIETRNPDPIREIPGEIPLICHEACNLLVAEIRKVVKGTASPQPATAA
jgi:sirohydrochlorin cobaltochelatase